MFCKGFGIVEISCFMIKNAGKDYHSEICIQTPFIRQPLILKGSLAQEHCSISLQYHVQMPFWKDFSEISTTKTFWKYTITDHTQLYWCKKKSILGHTCTPPLLSPSEHVTTLAMFTQMSHIPPYSGFSFHQCHRHQLICNFCTTGIHSPLRMHVFSTWQLLHLWETHATEGGW